MQRTIRILRIALPVAFVAFVLIIALSWNRPRVTKDKSQTQPVPATRTGDKPQAESKGFEDTQTIGGRIVSHISADRVVAYKSAWNTLENVRLTLYRQNGLTYDLSCPQAEFNSETKEANAQGGVKVLSSDGVEISTAQLHYDGNRLTNDIPVQFKIDRWQGNAGALDFDVQAETLHLARSIDATMTPETPVEPPMTIKAIDGVFRRNLNDVTFTQQVVMTRGADSVTADKIAGKFTPDRKSLLGMEGNGHVQMVMSGSTNPGEDLGGRKVIDCDRFFSELGPEGQIAAINAVGEPGLAHAVLDGPPKRDIVARTFRVALANRAVHELKAEWQVVMKEFGDVPRQSSADHVTVNFDPAHHRAITAFIEGAFKYHDPKTDATAVRANYDIVNDRVLLTAIPGFDPTVTSEGSVLKAKQIEFSPRAQTAKATGDVIAQLVSKGGPAADSTNLFPGGAGRPVFVNSDSLLMRQSNKTAIFTGNVKAWQETNTMLAQELQVQGSGDIVMARGTVRTVLYNTGSDVRKTPIVSKSDQLVARRSERRVDLTGNVQIDDETRTLTSEKATLFFDANRKIEHIESETKVVLVEKPTNRKMTGDKATYFVPKRMVYVDGAPATATGPQGSLSGQQIVYDLTRNHVQVVSPTGKTELNYKQP
ncbi:MAG TPA: LPS export ABC transporter periplasmic protein LptC [Thermoanaerobaculia bacterium]|nr:LPS export ABC transporter periplasmic protein LptC [Thermoanaerobaculia bacterium]